MALHHAFPAPTNPAGVGGAVAPFGQTLNDTQRLGTGSYAGAGPGFGKGDGRTNVSPHEMLFGPSGGGGMTGYTTTPQVDHTHIWAAFGDVLKLRSIIVAEVTEAQQWPIKLLLPMAPCDDTLQVALEEILFSPTSFDNVPEEGVPRITTQHTRSWRFNLQRYAKACVFSDDVLRLGAYGGMQIANSLRQLGQGVISILCNLAMEACAQAPVQAAPLLGVMPEQMNNRHSFLAFLREGTARWAMLQKAPHNMARMVQDMRTALLQQDVNDSDLLVLPPGALGVLKFNPAQMFSWLSGRKGGPHAPDVGVGKVVECDPMFLQDALTPGSYVNHMSSEEGIGNYAYLGPCAAVAQNLDLERIRPRDLGTRIYSEDRGNYVHIGVDEALTRSGLYDATGSQTDLGGQVLAGMGVASHTTWLDLYDAAGLWLPLWERYLKRAVEAEILQRMGAPQQFRRPVRGLWRRTMRWDTQAGVAIGDAEAALVAITRLETRIAAMADQSTRDRATATLNQISVAVLDAYTAEPAIGQRAAYLDVLQAAVVTIINGTPAPDDAQTMAILDEILLNAHIARATAYTGYDFINSRSQALETLLTCVIGGTRDTIDWLQRDHEIPPPFNFLLLRPYATYRMGTAMLATSGGRAGHTFVGKCDLSVTRTGTTKSTLMHVSFRGKPVVTNPRSITFARNVFCHQTLGGNGHEMWDPLDDNHREKHREGVLYRSIFVVATAPDWRPSDEPIDISGAFDTAYYSDAHDANPLDAVPGIRAYASYWGWDSKRGGMATLYGDTAKLEELKNTVPCSNTICFHAKQLLSGHEGRFDRVLHGSDHWGQFVYEGCESDRCGGAFLQYPRDAPVERIY